MTFHVFATLSAGNVPASYLDDNFAALQVSVINYGLDTGALNLVTVATVLPVTAYSDGQIYIIRCANTNLGATTINVNALGAKNLYRADGSALLPGDIVVGQSFMVIYNGLLNSAAGGFNLLSGAQLPEVNAVSLGADPTGVADSTTAFTNAITLAKKTIVPAGTYLVMPTTFTGLTGIHIEGTGSPSNAIIALSAAGTVWTFSNCQDCYIDRLQFQPSGTPANSSALKFNNGSNNNVVDHCWIYNFSGPAIQQVGVVGTQLSGNKVKNSYLLGNATTGSNGQLFMSYSNDFFIEGNQIGVTSGSAPFPVYGVNRANCSNGLFHGNYIWQQAIGMYDLNCSYNRVIANRFEQSQQNGFLSSGCAEYTFTENWGNNNGLQATNTYDTFSISTMTNSIVTDNQVFDWSGGVNSHRYSMSFTSCQEMTIAQNRCKGFATDPYYFDNATMATQNLNFDFSMSGSSSGVLSASSTYYLGANGTQTVEANAQMLVPRKSNVARLTAHCDAAPTGTGHVYTVVKNGTPSSLTCTIAAGAFKAFATNSVAQILVTPGDVLSVQVQTDATVTTTNHQVMIEFANY